MTVRQLKEKLKGLKDDTPVYIRDHDHGTYETNSMARTAELLNQKYAVPGTVDPEYKIKGDYFVISA